MLNTCETDGIDYNAKLPDCLQVAKQHDGVSYCLPQQPQDNRKCHEASPDLLAALVNQLVTNAL